MSLPELKFNNIIIILLYKFDASEEIFNRTKLKNLLKEHCNKIIKAKIITRKHVYREKRILRIAEVKLDARCKYVNYM